MVRALAAIALLLLAGCTSPTTPTTSEPTTVESLPPPPLMPWTLQCDPSGATQTARSAELVPGLQGLAAAVAGRIGEAVGDPVAGEPNPVDDTGTITFPTRKGSITLQMGHPVSAVGDVHKDERFQAALYRGNITWSEEQVKRVPAALGADTRTLRNVTHAPRQGAVWQEWGGLPLLGSGVAWFDEAGSARIHFGPLYTFRVREAQVDTEAAKATALAYMRCYLDKAGSTEARGFTIRGAKLEAATVANMTLAYLVEVSYNVKFETCRGDHDARWVYVDVWTGAVKLMDFAAC